MIRFQGYNKYQNQKTTIDNITFDSKREAARYAELKLLLKAGEIRDLQTQPAFILQEEFKDNYGKRHSAIRYIADFSYWETKKPEVSIVEDAKGMRTDIYKLKLKLFLHQYPHFIFREI